MATSPITSADLTLARAGAVDRPPSASASRRSAREACTEGRSPNTSGVTSASRSVKASTAPSTPIVSCRGSPIPLSERGMRTSHAASSNPQVPPRIPSTELSTSSWRTSRPRPAPSAARTAISVLRSSPLASSVVATFAQAIRSTRPTVPSSRSSAFLDCGGMSASLSGIVTTPTAFSSLPYCCLSCAAIASICDDAEAIDAPGVSRARTRQLCAVRPDVSPSSSEGIQISVPEGMSNGSGMTPTTPTT